MTDIPPPPPQYTPAPYAEAPKQGKGMAIASLVLGIVSVALCLYWFIALPAAIVAIILGVIARGKGAGKGLALGGIITGAIGALLGIALLVLSFSSDSFLDTFCDDNPDNPYCEQQ